MLHRSDRPAQDRPATSARPLSGLARLLGLPGEPRGTITGVTHDSRRVRRGDLYVAMPGANRHGAEFAAEAAESGAAAILTDPAGHDRSAATGLAVFVVPDPRMRLGAVASWVYGEPAKGLALIGVTGTSGKTTAAYLIEAGLRTAGHVTGLIGTVETLIAGGRAASELTTPEASDLHATLARMLERDVSAVTMEVSSHAIAMARIGGVRFDVAVFTNLSRDHLDFHPDMEHYFATKAALFTPAYARVGVVNIDDAHGRRLAESASVPVTTYSAAGSPAAAWQAADVRLGASGGEFRVVGPGGVEAEAGVALPGPFNVGNALAAIVALVEAGVPLQAAVEGVRACPGVPGRMERVAPGSGPGPEVIVDYSHKPGAVESVLTALRPVTEGRLIIVLGCGGDRDPGKRPVMGEVAARLADVAVLTSDNPRSEDPLRILAAMVDGVAEVPAARRARITVEPDRAAAIELAVSRAGPGDVVVVAGKGHEQGQYISGEVHPFDDREVAREAIKRRKESGT